MGLRLGKGETMEQINASMIAVAEGVLTSRAAHDLATKLGIECPIISQMFSIIHGALLGGLGFIHRMHVHIASTALLDMWD